MNPRHDITGKKYGRWTVLYRLGNEGRTWICQCECGTTKPVKNYVLWNGGSKSCGCFRDEDLAKRKTTHSHSPRNGKRARVWNIWSYAKTRCFNKNSTAYQNYGAKGITMCEEWKNSFEKFLEDMGECPSDKHSLDRIDNSQGYFPGNCRWATMKEQARNKTNNRILTFQGTTASLAEWCEKLGVPYNRISGRLSQGWDVERAFTEQGRYERLREQKAA